MTLFPELDSLQGNLPTYRHKPWVTGLSAKQNKTKNKSGNHIVELFPDHPSVTAE